MKILNEKGRWTEEGTDLVISLGDDMEALLLDLKKKGLNRQERMFIMNTALNDADVNIALDDYLNES